VLLNWNGRKHLEAFLPSVILTDYPNLRLLVLDNASTDDSVAWLGRTHPTVEVIQLDANYGFAEGNNRAVPHITTPYAVFLNTDVEVPPSWLHPLIRFLEAKPRVGAVQPKIKAYWDKASLEYAGAAGGYIDAWGYPFCRGRIFDTLEADTGQYDTPHRVFWATGACLAVRMEAIREVGLFEGRYFAHMEEIDLCWRLQRAGWQVWVEPAAQVWHVGGGALPKTNPFKTYLNFRNSLWTLRRNLPTGTLFWLLPLRFGLDWLEVMRALSQGRRGDARAILRAHRHALFRPLPAWTTDTAGLPCPPLTQLRGVYRKSIVWAYFARQKRTFSTLHQELIS
jgi:GT2 family glycosyltransferase